MPDFSWLERSGLFDSSVYDPRNIASNLVIAFFATDVALGTLIYIAGGLKENRRLLRLYYLYSIIGSVLTVLLASVDLGLSAKGWLTFDVSSLNFIIGVLTLMGCLVTIALQVYFVILLRKEILNYYKVAALNKRSTEYPIKLNDGEGQKEKPAKCESAWHRKGSVP